MTQTNCSCDAPSITVPITGIELKFPENAFDGIANTSAMYQCVPDYANMETTNRISTNNGTWTADRSGFVYVGASGASGTQISLWINGKEFIISHTDPNRGFGLFPVTRGDALKLTSPGTGSYSCYFIPPKFVKIDNPVIEE